MRTPNQHIVSLRIDSRNAHFIPKTTLLKDSHEYVEKAKEITKKREAIQRMQTQLNQMRVLTSETQHVSRSETCSPVLWKNDFEPQVHDFIVRPFLKKKKKKKRVNYMKKKSESSKKNDAPICNPSYHKSKTMWTAVGLQQEMAKKFKLTNPNEKRLKPGELTLAQKLGIAPKPPPPLTEKEWKEAEMKAVQRKDHQQPCPICMEPFGFSSSVILSCSHVFHKACLRSFERFIGEKGERTCPLCRKRQYQKKETTVGKEGYISSAATKIQALYRGYLARKQFTLKLLEKYPDRKREYYAEKLAKLSEKLLQRLSLESQAIDNFIEKLDESLKKTRLLFLTPEDWEKVRESALNRGLGECPICMCSLVDENDERALSRKCVITSCSHCFHAQCLLSFEKYSLDGDCSCPVCRAKYLKQDLVV